MRQSIRTADFVARYGGEEFVIILVGATVKHSIKIAETVMENMARLAIEHKKSSVSNLLTISMGISEILPAENIQSLRCIEQADRALYHAKKDGRNCFRVFKETAI